MAQAVGLHAEVVEVHLVEEPHRRGVEDREDGERRDDRGGEQGGGGGVHAREIGGKEAPVESYTPVVLSRRPLAPNVPLLVALIALLTPGRLSAQEAGEPAAAALPPGQEVDISTEFFGVGNVARPGDLAGVRLALTDTAPTPRDVAVQLHVRDADGDRALYTRFVTLNPEEPMGVWLYPRLPWSLGGGSTLTVTVRRVDVGEDGSLAIGRQLAAGRVSASKVVPDVGGLIGVIGRQALGLEQYAITPSNYEVSASSHETKTIVADLLPAVLPDDWRGWCAFDTLLWSDAEPDLLGAAQTQAISEWVHRGGHLVIAVPGVGNPWASPRNPLADLLPRASMERLVEADLRAYAHLLLGSPTKDTAANFRMDADRLGKTTVHVFRVAPDAEVREATPVFAGPHGVVAVRRLVGAGMVTLVGLDLAERSVRTTMRADAFWGRVLGERADTLTATEAEQAASDRFKFTRRMGATRLVDAHIPRAISRTQSASVGLLVGLVLFIAYWLIAGPLGFAVLKARGLERHAWVMFLGTALAFTAVAWAGASWLRPKQAELLHYTVLDHVYGQPVQRARMFASVLLPTYGEERVSVGEPGADEGWRQSLTPFIEPEAGTLVAFPDARAYLVDTRDSSSLTVPSRSTIKSFVTEWLGGPRWAMPRPVSPGQEPRLSESGSLAGALTHDLPGPLSDVLIIVVHGQTSEEQDLRAADRGIKGRLKALATGRVKQGPWSPGETLDLAEFAPAPLAEPITDFLKRLTRYDSLSLTGGEFTVTEAENALTLYSVLEPPDYAADMPATGPVDAIIQRRIVHGMDLGAWFTQPCVIVVGRLENAPPPFPVSVNERRLDGTDLPASGRTVVRWVYPLAPDPPVFTGPGRAGGGDA